MDLDLLAGLVEERVQRNLTPSEWQRYVGPGIAYRRTCPDLPAAEDPPSSAIWRPEPLKGVKLSRPPQHEEDT